MELNIKDLIERIYYVVSDEQYYTIKLYLDEEDGLLYDYDDDDNPDYDDDCYKILCDCEVDEIYDVIFNECLANEMDADEFIKVYIDKLAKAIKQKLKEEYIPKKIQYPTYIEKDNEMVETGEFLTGEVTYTFHNYGKHIEIEVSLDID